MIARHVIQFGHVRLSLTHCAMSCPSSRASPSPPPRDRTMSTCRLGPGALPVSTRAGLTTNTISRRSNLSMSQDARQPPRQRTRITRRVSTHLAVWCKSRAQQCRS